MTPEQCIEARKLLGWSRDRLGGMSHVTTKVIEMYERNGRVVRDDLRASGTEQLAAVRNALEAAGVEFIDQNGGDPAGVRLRNAEA